MKFDWWEYCQRWRTPEALEAIDQFYTTDYFQFVHNFLCFGSGSYAGKPFEMAKFQIDDLIGPLLYKIRPDGTRQYREAGWWMPRKNAKSEVCSSLGVYEVSCSREKAEVILAGGQLEEAEIVFNCASYMAEHDPSLKNKLKVTATRKTIVNTSTGATLKAVATNKEGKHGKNPSMIIGDELHTWQYREMWTSLTTGSDTRPQPLFIRITTSSDNDPEKLETEEYEYAARVKEDPSVDPGYLSVLYVADKERDNWESEETWRKVNPGLVAGFKSIDGMRRMAEKAKANPRLKNDFCRLHLNMRLGSIAKWIDMTKWDACSTAGDIKLRSTVYGGLDLASTTDVASWCLFDGATKFRWHHFIPRERMREIEDRDRVPYSIWSEAGHVTATPGEVIDYSFIIARIQEDAKRYNIKAVGYDPWNAESTRQSLEKDGLEMVAVRQGVGSLSAPCKEFERLIISLICDHGGDPIARWMAANVEVHTDTNGNIKPIRPKHMASGKKIDGIIAAVMCVAMRMNQDAEFNPAARMGPIFLDL